MFKGSVVAIVTPFKEGRVDESTFRDLIERQIKGGTSAILPCGTTGESATLTFEEHERVIKIAIEQADKRVPVMAGTGSNSTQEAIELTRQAAQAGADASLQVSPYYNKPTQKGLYEHFRAVADAVDIPVILYNIASRTGVNIEPSTMAQLVRDCRNIVGVKEASGSLDQMARVVALCPDDFVLLSGDDALTLPVLSIGGRGVVSVVANIVPEEVAGMVAAFESGDLPKAAKIYYKLLPLIKAMFIETNPIPVKTAMGMMGLCSPELRLPMTAMLPDNETKLRNAVKDYGVLS
ncbi:MAG: 4-hydroxy-tetrahydrodipicolinate synthase [Candidatus Omnitrophica bacterium]|nr:4-hydroxy-tetrahydrodipicolinate synthase [Candidatus Omnitrophota bacterium]